MTLVELGTHLATERARLVTLHLPVGAPDFYPSELRMSQRNLFLQSSAWKSHLTKVEQTGQ